MTIELTTAGHLPFLLVLVNLVLVLVILVQWSPAIKLNASGKSRLSLIWWNRLL